MTSTIHQHNVIYWLTVYPLRSGLMTGDVDACFSRVCVQLTEKTRAALDKQVSQKIAAAMPVRAADKQAPAQYIRYGCWLVK